MLHLPALVLTGQINQIIQAVGKLGLAVRGLYGEGTEATGNLFQISNQITLGESEKDILERLGKVVAQIIEHEENARENLAEKKAATVNDQVGRAYGILTNAWYISSKEALNLLSVLRLGCDLAMFKVGALSDIDDLLIETQPGHLQKKIGRKLASEERDHLRAELIRDKFKELARPIVRITPPAGQESKNHDA